jgi:hypothetical protein
MFLNVTLTLLGGFWGTLKLFALTLLYFIGTLTFLSPCGPKEDGGFMTCHWAGQAMLGIGLLLCLQSLAALLIWDNRIRVGLFLSCLMTAILGLVTPGTLIDLCRMSTMRCRSLMRPAMLILCGLCTLLSLLGIFQEWKRNTHHIEHKP